MMSLKFLVVASGISPGDDVSRLSTLNIADFSIARPRDLEICPAFGGYPHLEAVSLLQETVKRVRNEPGHSGRGVLVFPGANNGAQVAYTVDVSNGVRVDRNKRLIEGIGATEDMEKQYARYLLANTQWYVCLPFLASRLAEIREQGYLSVDGSFCRIPGAVTHNFRDVASAANPYEMRDSPRTLVSALAVSIFKFNRSSVQLPLRGGSEMLLALIGGNLDSSVLEEGVSSMDVVEGLENMTLRGDGVDGEEVVVDAMTETKKEYEE